MKTYLFIILLILSFFLLEKLIKSKYKIYEKIGITILVIISALRFETGTDYLSYKQIFDNLARKIEFSDYYLLEKGYIFINKMIIYLGLNFNFLIGIISFVYIVLVYKTLKKYEYNNIFLGIFIFLTSFNIYFLSLSIIRQSLAIAISFYSIRYVIEKEQKKYIFAICLGAFFHKGILLMLPFYYIDILSGKIISYINYFLVISFLFRQKILFLLQNIVEKINISKYNGYFIGVNLEIAKIAVYYVCIYLIYFLIITKEIKKNDNKQKRIIYKYIYFYILLRLVMSIGLNSLLYRVVPFFEIYFILFIPEIYKELKKEIKIVFITGIFLFQSIFFIYDYSNWLKISEHHYKSNKEFKIKI